MKLVARRHRVSESLLYNWRSAWKAAASATTGRSGAVAFVPLGVLDEACSEAPAALPEPPPQRGEGGAGAIEIALPNGARIRVDALVNEQALSRVLRAMRGST